MYFWHWLLTAYLKYLGWLQHGNRSYKWLTNGNSKRLCST